jgi:hypothetical protein
MSDFEDIQRLLRLKRHERPPEDFVEDFLHRFHQRQRKEMLQHSARGLLWERINTYFEGLFAPRWRWAGATAVALVAGVFFFKPAPAPSNSLAGQFEVRSVDVNDMKAPVTDTEVERYLISKHFDGGFGNEATTAQGLPNLTPAPQQDRLPTGYIRQDAEVK